MQKNKWSRKFDWIKLSDGTYIQQTRSEYYDENRYIAVGDIYFRFNKYLTGVTYSYINSLDNIYKRDLLTGDGYSIVNMYNEYDIIDYALKNSILVDVAADSNIDINKQWFNINEVKLKPGHLILLMNQNSEFQNDIYIVNNQFFLENAGFLSSRDKSYRFSCGVKLGKNYDKQFFLTNNGYSFPIIGEPKYFIEGKSFILKNMIKYNLYNTSTSSPSKIIFTDYDLARKQLNENYTLYDQFDFQINSATIPIGPTGTTTPINYFTIDYHHDSYIIRVPNGDIKYTGNTSSIMNLNHTLIPYNNMLDFSIGDSVMLNIISGSTTMLSLQSFIKDIKTGFIILEDTIPKNILSDLSDTYFQIENLNVAVDWMDAFDKLSTGTTYSDYFSVSVITDVSPYPIVDVIIKPKECDYNRYFDYDSLIFSINNNFESYRFETLNQYVSYKLYNNLSYISTGITSDTTIFNDYLLDDIQYDYTDNGRIRLITNQSGITNIYKPYTYVDVVGSDSLTGRTLVYDVNDYEVVIEKPFNWNNILPLPGVISIQNIGNMLEISDILYEVYMNDDYEWYSRKNDNEKKYISKVYAEILIDNKFIRDIITGIIYENNNNEFVLKLYDLGTVVNGDIPTTDKNLYYSAIELIYVGVDKKTRLPISINNSSGTTSHTIDWYVYNQNINNLNNIYSAFKSSNDNNVLNSGKTINDDYWDVLNGGLNDTLDGIDSVYIGDYFSAGLNNVLPGPNNPSLLYNIVNGNDSVVFTTTTTTTTTIII